MWLDVLFDDVLCVMGVSCHASTQLVSVRT